MSRLFFCFDDTSGLPDLPGSFYLVMQNEVKTDVKFIEVKIIK